MTASTANARHSEPTPSALQTTSLWSASATLPVLAPVTRDERADVCIIGSGIAGLSVAYHLARAGTSVLVVEHGTIGGGETARTTAHLSPVLDTRYSELETLHGTERTPQIAASHLRAIDEIEATILREGIACDFARVDGYLFATPHEDPSRLESEYAAARRAGLKETTWVERAPLLPFDTRRCLRFPNQAQLHPLRYLAGLAEAVVRLGGRLVAGHVDGFDGPPHAVVRLADGHTITAGAVVVATNSPVNDRLTIHTKQAAYRSYVIAAPVPIGTIPAGLYWDTAEPYHYVRTQPHDAHHDLVIVGGEDHHTGQGDHGLVPFDRLEEWAHARFDPLGPVAFRWSGQILASIDGLAFIGRNPGDADNVFIATGDSGNGMTHGTIAGLLVADLILGRTSPWAALYEPGRITPRAAWTFAKESLHVAAGYARWLTPSHLQARTELAPGNGAVLQRGLRKIAAYRDEHGALHECSAVCPHLGGIVVWNDVEKSWDCPCHGSRFDTNGCVLNGPAIAGLEPA